MSICIILSSDLSNRGQVEKNHLASGSFPVQRRDGIVR